MKRTKFILKILAILPCLLVLLSCDNILNDSQQSASLLILTKLSGQTAGGGSADFYESDVQDDLGFVHEDVSIATLEAKLKETVSVLGPSYQNSIRVTEYTVRYEVVDTDISPVPSPPQLFRGSLNIVIEIDATINVSFIIVRASAKNEAPLDQLKLTNNYLLVKATVTFYGEDLAGNPVQDSGDITINFADWVGN